MGVRRQRHTILAASRRGNRQANSAPLPILVAHLVIPQQLTCRSPSMPLTAFLPGVEARCYFCVTVKELSFSHEEGNPKISH